MPEKSLFAEYTDMCSVRRKVECLHSKVFLYEYIKDVGKEYETRKECYLRCKCL